MPTTALLEGTSGQDFLQPSLEIPEPTQKQETIQDYARKKVSDRWYKKQFQYLDNIIQVESGWVATAKNPTSTAYGIGQFLIGTWDDVGCVKSSNPKYQIDCMIDYVEQRYVTPEKAWEFRKENGWY